eukprot:CAMPEP_0185551666 /NCGR_PEP_ID=MMETSP1381-20130426/28564_1 /TAXON_ID=298111 /ORGANISM="Pavlova sp., Strain CCMP459" /LENGTH=52 /DNA_ID=CAMNT_0028164555 /DNA_START=492 /DNA_END=646 /DNA_ORIENTATION=-
MGKAPSSHGDWLSSEVEREILRLLPKNGICKLVITVARKVQGAVALVPLDAA